jgi:hypothetical protein
MQTRQSTEAALRSQKMDRQLQRKSSKPLITGPRLGGVLRLQVLLALDNLSPIRLDRGGEGTVQE